jgi:hypothetical protein
MFLSCPAEVVRCLYISIIKLMPAKQQGMYEVIRGIDTSKRALQAFRLEDICNNDFCFRPKLLVVNRIPPYQNLNPISSCKQLVDQPSPDIAGSPGYQNFASSRHRLRWQIYAEKVLMLWRK